jgi:hypothetical protein
MKLWKVEKHVCSDNEEEGRRLEKQEGDREPKEKKDST